MASGGGNQGGVAVNATGALVLSDGTAYLGVGLGHVGAAVGELCFNTAMTGHQEILSDPSYARQIVAFTFPHVGNVGANGVDDEASSPPALSAARGVVLRAPVTAPSNWRAEMGFSDWLARRGLIGVAGVDTRALARRIREKGMPHAAIAHDQAGRLDLAALAARAKAWEGIEGQDLVADVAAGQTFVAEETPWDWPLGVGRLGSPRFEVVVVDYGVKRNILRALAGVGARAHVVSARASAQDILARRPDGVVLSNGPGDPAATARYAGPIIKALVNSGTPILAICLGHQMLALALGGRTVKMGQGHHGANHPVKDLTTGRVEIVSMNHGFAVDAASLPAGARESHVSLFDGSNCGIALEGRPVLSVQHHPEASPGPHDALGVFERFAALMAARKAA